MYDDEVLSEWIAFRLTPETRQKLNQWARTDRCELADLLHTIVSQAVAAEEQRRGKPFAIPLVEYLHS
jgi:hypothetical protein